MDLASISSAPRVYPQSGLTGSGQEQQPALRQGQFLQGTVSAHKGGNQFVLTIGGREVAVESTVPLRVGGRLDLQVEALAPRVELRIADNTLDSRQVNRLISNSLPHMTGIKTSFASLDALAGRAATLPSFSADSRQTLQWYAAALTTPSGTASFSLPAQTLTQLLSAALPSLQASISPPEAVSAYEKTARLLQQAANALPPEAGRQAMRLATLFFQAAQALSKGTATVYTAGAAFPQGVALAPGLPPGQQASTLMSLLFRVTGNLPLEHPVRQLALFLAEYTGSGVSAARSGLDGKILRETGERLGMNMERLLAEGRRGEATHTLKYALLDLAQNLPPGEEGKDIRAAGLMTRAIEGWQAVQIRLATESLFFIPLPFSFLNQGYLLVSDEGSQEQEERSSGQNGLQVSLRVHLEGLGNLRIDIAWKEEGSSFTFFAEDRERARFLSLHHDELKEFLTTAHPESVRFLTGAGDPMAELLAKAFPGADDGMINTKA